VTSENPGIGYEKNVRIRPAATLLLVRDGHMGIEVLTLKRSENMRFLPGHIAFPGGAVDEEDRHHLQMVGDVHVTAGMNADDAVYAVAALRECAEEIGWACALSQHGRAVAEQYVSHATQAKLLQSEVTYQSWLHENGYEVDFGRLRFVGRWVTPPTMPARFDTRFFLYRMVETELTPSVHLEENDWARWLDVAETLSKTESGNYAAAPPTVAMLKGLKRQRTVEECFETLHIPGPPPQP
jgi:8-oxo-dGTP pyrophosphatase MutT (NUDIX family)